MYGIYLQLHQYPQGQRLPSTLSGAAQTPTSRGIILIYLQRVNLRPTIMLIVVVSIGWHRTLRLRTVSPTCPCLREPPLLAAYVLRWAECRIALYSLRCHRSTYPELPIQLHNRLHHLCCWSHSGGNASPGLQRRGTWARWGTHRADHSHGTYT